MRARTKLLIIAIAIALGTPLGYFGCKKFGQNIMMLVGGGMVASGAILSANQVVSLQPKDKIVPFQFSSKK